MSEKRLEGKRAIVTGGAQGIGEGIVDKFLAEGARVVSFDRDYGAEPVERHGGRLLELACDVSRIDQVERATQAAVEHLGGLDVLVNNAGVGAKFDPVEMTEEEWDTFFAIDLKSLWLCAKFAIPALREAGGGAIVNIASVHAFMTTDNFFPYAAAKSGVVGLTRNLALDLGRDGIRVLAVCPGYVRTRLVDEWLRSQPPAAEERVLSFQPLGRTGTPADIGNFVAFLASDEASYITGVPLLIDGGLSARFAR